jgi:hypothetical protein
VTVAEKDPFAPVVKVVLFELVKDGAWSTVRVKDCVVSGETQLVAVMTMG